MGIKNLHKFLRKNCPDIYNEKSLSNYSYKKLAIDISLYIFKYKTIFGTNWIDAFINLVSCLRMNEIHCIFVYDTSSPPEKDQEKKNRLSQKNKLIERIKILEESLDHYYKTDEINDVLKEIWKKRKKPSLLYEQPVNIKIIESELEKQKSYVVNITPKDIELTKQLFDILKVPYVNADFEAETLCSQLCIEGKVDGVLSEDTDVLAYGAPIFVTKINTGDSTCVEISFSEILEDLDINKQHFLDFCIMCGTDYNSNIFKIGPEKSFKLIKEHGDIEDIEKKSEIDIAILNHKRVRELFTFSKNSGIDISYCGTPDFDKLHEFIIENNCKINIKKVTDSFKPKEFLFLEN